MSNDGDDKADVVSIDDLRERAGADIADMGATVMPGECAALFEITERVTDAVSDLNRVAELFADDEPLLVEGPAGTTVEIDCDNMLRRIHEFRMAVARELLDFNEIKDE